MPHILRVVKVLAPTFGGSWLRVPTAKERGAAPLAVTIRVAVAHKTSIAHFHAVEHYQCWRAGVYEQVVTESHAKAQSKNNEKKKMIRMGNSRYSSTQQLVMGDVRYEFLL